MTNKNVGLPVPWATYWEEEAFPPAPKPSQGSSSVDMDTAFGDEVVMTECHTPRGNDNVATSPSPGNMDLFGLSLIHISEPTRPY